MKPATGEGRRQPSANRTPAVAHHRPHAGGTPAPDAAGTDVLIVEDDEGSRVAMTNILEDRGYRVAAVVSAEDALDVLRLEPLPRLIVLDLMLPEMEGWEFRHEQKKDARLADIPVIGVSAVGKLVDVEYSLRKPLDYDQFLHAVGQYVPRSGTTRSPR